MAKELYLNLLKGIRKRLRQNQTPSEKALWTHIRKMKLGYKFRRQVSIGYYVVDFYCKDLNLAVEIDGPVHDDEHIKNRDRLRQEEIQSKNVEFLRFSNEQVSSDLSFVLMTIKKTCDRIRHSAPPSGELPQGEGVKHK